MRVRLGEALPGRAGRRSLAAIDGVGEMGRFGRVVAALGLMSGLSGCIGVYAPIALSTDAAYTVYGNPVNPTPAPGYAVQCSAVSGPSFLLISGTVAGCEQVQSDIVSVRG